MSKKNAPCFFCISALNLSVKSLRPVFAPAFFAMKRPVARRLKRKFCYFFSTVTAFPTSLKHFFGSKASSFRPVFAPAFFAMKRSVARRLKRKFCYFFSTVTAFPTSLKHFFRRKIFIWFHKF